MESGSTYTTAYCIKEQISFKTLPAGLLMTFFKHWMTETLEKLTPLTTVSYQEKSLSEVEENLLQIVKMYISVTLNLTQKSKTENLFKEEILRNML